MELLSDYIRLNFEPMECLAENVPRRGRRLITVLKDSGDKASEVWLSQQRHLGVVGHRSTLPIEHRRSGTQ